jgi:hypothetical protein
MLRGMPCDPGEAMQDIQGLDNGNGHSHANLPPSGPGGEIVEVCGVQRENEPYPCTQIEPCPVHCGAKLGLVARTGDRRLLTGAVSSVRMFCHLESLSGVKDSWAHGEGVSFYRSNDKGARVVPGAKQGGAPLSLPAREADVSL